MWDRLKQADIERARQELERRRANTLARHALELDELRAEGAEIETLRGLIDAFTRKFRTPAEPVDAIAAANGLSDVVAAHDPVSVAPSDQTAAPDAATLPDRNLPAAAQAAAATPPPRRGAPAQGEYPRTNFEAISRAIANASF